MVKSRRCAWGSRSWFPSSIIGRLTPDRLWQFGGASDDSISALVPTADGVFVGGHANWPGASTGCNSHLLYEPTDFLLEEIKLQATAFQLHVKRRRWGRM